MKLSVLSKSTIFRELCKIWITFELEKFFSFFFSSGTKTVFYNNIPCVCKCISSFQIIMNCVFLKMNFLKNNGISEFMMNTWAPNFHRTSAVISD